MTGIFLRRQFADPAFFAVRQLADFGCLVIADFGSQRRDQDGIFFDQFGQARFIDGKPGDHFVRQQGAGVAQKPLTPPLFGYALARLHRRY